MFDDTPHHGPDPTWEPIQFPVDAARSLRCNQRILKAANRGAEWAFRDRRMHVLARRLGCLGHYDGSPDEPHAA